jgi:integrase
MEMGTPLRIDLPGELMRDTFARLNRVRTVLPPIRFHDLRHVHATLLLQDGEPVHVVAERLGPHPSGGGELHHRVAPVVASRHDRAQPSRPE